MKRLLIAVATFGGALWAGWQMPVGPDLAATATAVAPDASSPIPAEQTRPGALPAGTMTCAGGAEGPLGVQIVPVRTVAGASGEVLRYAVELRNRSGADLRARYALELVTDVGTPVLSPETSARVDLGAVGSTSDERDTPSGLADGFYILRVTAVATGAGG